LELELTFKQLTALIDTIKSYFNIIAGVSTDTTIMFDNIYFKREKFHLVEILAHYDMPERFCQVLKSNMKTPYTSQSSSSFSRAYLYRKYRKVVTLTYAYGSNSVRSNGKFLLIAHFFIIFHTVIFPIINQLKKYA
jgi:hypothetical protein